MTASAFAAQAIRSAILDLRRFWGRIKTAFIIGLVVAFALAATAAAAFLAVHAARNRSIATLIGGHDVAVATDAAPKLIFARAYFLMNHNRLEDAQALVSRLDIRGSRRLRADLHYDMANASLKVAFDKIDERDFDAAGAFVSLAREDFREAMRLDPDDWDARFNFDVASRLVREYPTFGFTPDPRRRGPRPLWTELPNAPEGEP
jgi:mxaK protein